LRNGKSAAPIYIYGTEEQKQELLPKILQGEACVGLGMSEPEAGSDLGCAENPGGGRWRLLCY